ncbi:hypothetical protein Taro_013609 [Colocasia esculenta]|uniref:Alkane hydroxylase MAH1-like n=1 Tax=Colocasia esculenta TaxID=4460 RepID=A0A843UG07_COLES|nr:hypothetical protein [Colocasia esculenta]
MTNLAKLALAYPEILLSVTCFLLLFLRLGRRGSNLPTNWPLLGMLPALLSSLYRYHDWVTDILRKSGCTFLFNGPWFSGMNILVTSDPANINHIFNSNFANYPKGEEFLEMFDILGDGIFNADHDSWKSQRKAAHALISDHKFRRFVAATSRDMVERGLVPVLSRAAEERSAVDLQDLFLRFTFDATCKQVFGVNPGCLSPSLPVVPFARAMDDAEEVLFSRHVLPRSWWNLLRRFRIGEERKMALAWEAIDYFIENQVEKKMEEVSKFREHKADPDEEMATDLLTSYLDRRPAVGDVAVESKKFLRDTTVNLMLAGRDTTGSALTWFFWMMSQHPDVEHKILEELGAILVKKQETCNRGNPVLFNAEDLTSAVYLHAALYESLRLFPPVPQEHKAAVQPDVLPSGDRVDPKTKIIVSLYAMGRIEGVWGKDCREFKPERWISERGRLRHEPSYKFLSFNSGPRTCLGKDMAFTQMKVVAAALIYNFRIRVVEGHVVAPKLSIILHMAHGLMSSGVIKRHTLRHMFKSSGVIKRHTLRHMFKSSGVIKRHT